MCLKVQSVNFYLGIAKEMGQGPSGTVLEWLCINNTKNGQQNKSLIFFL